MPGHEPLLLLIDGLAKSRNVLRKMGAQKEQSVGSVCPEDPVARSLDPDFPQRGMVIEPPNLPEDLRPNLVAEEGQPV